MVTSRAHQSVKVTMKNWPNSLECLIDGSLAALAVTNAETAGVE